jgi:hypothetical protein
VISWQRASLRSAHVVSFWRREQHKNDKARLAAGDSLNDKARLAAGFVDLCFDSLA